MSDMVLATLRMHAFRCIAEADIDFYNKINMIHGMNGSGKTSVLEAIYCISLAKSFRCRQTRLVVQHGAPHATLFAELVSDGLTHRIGIERNANGSGVNKLDGQLITSVAPLAQQLPVCLLHPERLKYLSAGPKSRRQLMDWGLFYEAPTFHGMWQRTQQAIRQRNAALRQGASSQEMAVWNAMLCGLAPQIDAMRAAYLARLGGLIDTLCERLFDQPLALSWRYMRGWPQDMALEDALASHWQRDLAMGYTHHGPHRADFAVQSHGFPVHQVLSQGQQKLLAYAVLLAQAALLKATRPSLLLVDDLPAELDARSIEAVAGLIAESGLQTFITAITPDAIPAILCGSNDCRMFHVKHGVVSSPVPA